jgi:A/G-specific adenine glycosylase
MSFGKTVLEWYAENKRELPWRHTTDAYKIWLSEVIMQQTQISRGTEYYLKFVESYPTIHDLAEAEEQEVLLLWQGLGYYSRARNLLFTAKTIVQNFKGVFPSDYKELIKLKGIGDYTASMIASVSFSKSYAAIDGNVLRFISRFEGIEEAINTREGKERIRKFAQNHIIRNNPGDFNQAMMEFGATVCTKHKPQCNNCVFKSDCHAFQYEKTDVLPYKLSSSKKQKIYIDYFVILNEEKTEIILQQKQSGFWKNLYEFPNVYSKRKASIKTTVSSFFRSNKELKKNNILKSSEAIKHVLSHRELFIRFIVFFAKEFGEVNEINETEIVKVNLAEIDSYPFPNPIKDYIEKEMKVL